MFILIAQPFELQCVGDVTPSGLIEVSCATERVLESLTCTVDEANPETCEYVVSVMLSCEPLHYRYMRVCIHVWSMYIAYRMCSVVTNWCLYRFSQVCDWSYWLWEGNAYCGSNSHKPAGGDWHIHIHIWYECTFCDIVLRIQTLLQIMCTNTKHNDCRSTIFLCVVYYLVPCHYSTPFTTQYSKL